MLDIDSTLQTEQITDNIITDEDEQCHLNIFMFGIIGKQHIQILNLDIICR